MVVSVKHLIALHRFGGHDWSDMGAFAGVAISTVLSCLPAVALDLSSAAAVSSGAVATSSFTSAISSAPVPSSFTWRSVPNTAFREGEELSFVIKWGVITAGYSTLAVPGVVPIDGRPAYHLVSEAKSAGMASAFYKVEDHNEAWLDKGALVSVRYEKRIREGKFRIEESILIDQIRHRFLIHSYRIDKNLYEQKEGEVPPNVLDVYGSLYFVRTLPLDVGDVYTIDVISGEKIYPLEVRVKKLEKVKVPAGKFDTFLVEPLLRGPGIFISKGKKLEVWLTADERRMPVRMRSEVFIGHVSAELIRYRAP
jgi:hypothetical protein